MKKLNIDEIERLLVVYPHPDDEAFFGAGLMLRLARNAKRVDVLCLTRGEASTLRFHVEHDQSLAEVRTKEFLSSMSQLGVNDYRILNYPDGLVSHETVIESIQESINKSRPTHILTFEPSGIYGHPDHIATSQAVSNLASQQNISVIYSTIKLPLLNKFESEFAKVLREANPILPNAKLILSPSLIQGKLKTLREYRSQVQLGPKFIRQWGLRQLFLIEYYHLKSISNA